MTTKPTVAERAREIAIAALNEAHRLHGFDAVAQCKFCTSMAAEMTVARHIEAELSALRAKVESLELTANRWYDRFLVVSRASSEQRKEIVSLRAELKRAQQRNKEIR